MTKATIDPATLTAGTWSIESRPVDYAELGSMTTTQTPKFEVHRTMANERPAIELVVRWATASAELDALTTRLGYRLTEDIANRRHIICTTPAEVDAARNPLARFFDGAGEWKG